MVNRVGCTCIAVSLFRSCFACTRPLPESGVGSVPCICQGWVIGEEGSLGVPRGWYRRVAIVLTLHRSIEAEALVANVPTSMAHDCRVHGSSTAPCNRQEIVGRIRRVAFSGPQIIDLRSTNRAYHVFEPKSTVY